MPRISFALIVCIVTPFLAAAEQGPRTADPWHEVAHLDGNRVGALHTTVTPDRSTGLLRVTSTLQLTLRRYGALVRLHREQGTLEDTDGKVVGVFMRQGTPGGKQLTLAGRVEDGRLQVSIDNGRIERRLPWPEDVLGLLGQERFFAARRSRPGDRLSFSSYDPTYNAVVRVRVAVKEREVVDLPGGRRELLRVELTPDPLQAPGRSVQPPRSIWWLDDAFVPQRRQTELDGLGQLVLTRASRDAAGAPVGGSAPDVGARSLVPLNRAILAPYASRLVHYRVTVRGEDEAARLLVSDEHQEVRNARGDSFELLVHPVRPGGGGDAAPADEYLAPSRFLDSDEPTLRALARRAVAGESDPWRKAVRIEAFVKGLMRNDNQAELVPASAVARTPRGDCRHHALLTAALCRAVGLGSRTAIGLLYVHRDGPKLGFHMWTEVYVGGRWLGLDSTLGRGGVSATHVKISEHSWHQVESLTPLLPVTRVLGKLQVEVLRGS